MDLRLLLLIATAACAPMIPEQPSVQEPPAPPPAAPTPEPTAPSATPTEQMAFDAWRESFLDRRAGANREAWARELAGLTPDQRVVDRDRSQPEFSSSAGSYISRAMTADRIARGRDLIGASPWMRDIESQYGVPREILVAIWAQESAFGRIQGDFDVVRSLATLAWEGRRRDWAEGQLVDALRIVTEGRRDRARLLGSWAGAMGQTQFMPDNYLRLGRDHDGDGFVDIWGSDRDALASAANLLATAGWRRGQSWGAEVILPDGFDYALAETDRSPWATWRARGVRRADGGEFTAAEAAEEALILLPAGAQGPAFLALPNHYVIRRYNNSVSYALSVGLLGDAMMGRPGLSKFWPQEEPMSRDQRFAAQRALAALGYDPGGIDGVIGSGTRAALRRWQQARGLLADGHLTAALVERLRAEAGV